MSKLPKAALSLKQFMLRQEVLKLYRTIFRTIRQVPDASSRRELRDWARADFRNNRNQTDELAIKMLLQHGNRSLKELQTSLELSGSGPTDTASHSDATKRS
ncbi:LYR motif-containing protein 2 [Anopheles arabiensis]|uniref:LYR motif-containing protein 2 n=2 Tax=gambiae species complex TaxID=44542 RepID=Q7PZA6_ANOGA|nr:LYR motif-containing protein 2 [Anopheles arabiensis]XP_320699.3 LYR motif-containing protein 2 [Anopheles gambiae]EAA00691.3 AGAP011816-PA [Anopheles gambiae str. PEST]